MKLIHLSDLHLGKRLYAYQRLDEQRQVLDQILSHVDREQPDAVLIAGDVYDRPVPPEDAIALMSDFLMSLNRRGLPVLIISGNHDSAERIAFAADLLENSRIYISPAYHGEVKRILLRDAWGEVAFHLLPFIKPTDVRQAFPEEAEEIRDYTDALRAAIARMDLSAPRNVLLAHQFVTGAERSESEELAVGGQDNVSAEVFSAFNYVALGHLHRPQQVGGDPRLRYSGTPLVYSVSESAHEKTVTVVELDGDGTLAVRTLPLHMPRAVQRVRGSFQALLDGLPGMDSEAYLDFVITDDDETPDAARKLRERYHYMLAVHYDNARTRELTQGVLPDLVPEDTDPLTAFEELFEIHYKHGFSPEQRTYLEAVLADLRRDQP